MKYLELIRLHIMRNQNQMKSLWEWTDEINAILSAKNAVSYRGVSKAFAVLKKDFKIKKEHRPTRYQFYKSS